MAAWQMGTWLTSVAYGILGAAAFYYLQPVLFFKPDMSSGSITMLSALSGGLAMFGTTAFFRKQLIPIAYIGVGLILLHLAANILLTYGLMDQLQSIMFVASSLSIPIGILWYFVLKYQASSHTEDALPGTFAVAEVFKSTATKIFGIVVLGLCAFLIFYRLGYFDIWEDENLVINAAVGVTKEGWSYFEEGYARARIHTLMVAGLFELFGDGVLLGRMPSAVFGLCFVLLCYFVFARWYGLAWLAILLPLICLMNDRFLLLFRYLRMYALLIPLFLAGTYIMVKTIDIFQRQQGDIPNRKDQIRKWSMVIICFLFLLLLAHVHKLSMIFLPVMGLYILYQVWHNREKAQMRLLWFVCGSGALLLFFTFIVELEALNMFRQVASRIFAAHNPRTAYYEYMMNNALPVNGTVTFLVAGLGLLMSNISTRQKSLLVLNYLFIIIGVVSMVHLVGSSGRDYRYIAHLVPFVVCTVLIVVYYAGRSVSTKIYPWGLVTVFLISLFHFHKDYKRNYIRHPWSPRYSQVYNTLVSNYAPGDALIIQNVKTYYLDPVALAGDHLLKVSKKGDYTLDQFKEDVRSKGHGWVMWELHKSHHLQMEIRRYIYKKFKPFHNANLDDLGVELFYFDETMVPQD